jgi:hypothetical protein
MKLRELVELLVREKLEATTTADVGAYEKPLGKPLRRAVVDKEHSEKIRLAIKYLRGE